MASAKASAFSGQITRPAGLAQQRQAALRTHVISARRGESRPLVQQPALGMNLPRRQRDRPVNSGSLRASAGPAAGIGQARVRAKSVTLNRGSWS